MGRAFSCTPGLALLVLALPACGTAPKDDATDIAGIGARVPIGAELSLGCSGCHGPPAGAMSGLEGRPPESLRAALLQYRQDVDCTSVMHRMMRGYSETEIYAISRYLSEKAQP